MTGAMKLTLLAIALFVLLTAGTFIWFVATWDPATAKPVVSLPPANPKSAPLSTERPA